LTLCLRDLQHEELISIINELETAHESGRDKDVLDEVLPRLASYVLFHFGTEESMMQGSAGSTAHAQRHRDQHRDFMARVESIKVRRDDDGRAVADLLDYIKRWLTAHIMKTDRELAGLIKQRPGAATGGN